MKAVYMPALGMAQKTGTLLEWHKQAGESVVAGESLMLVATDKTEVEIEAPASGVLTAVRAQPGDEVPVGQVIAVILSAEEASAHDAAGSATILASPAAASPAVFGTTPQVTPVAARVAAEHGVDPRAVPATKSRVYKADVLEYVWAGTPSSAPTPNPRTRTLASPKARRLAREQGLDLATLTGHGPDGAVVAADVIAASNNVDDQPMESGLRRAEAPGISDKAAGAVSSATAATLPVSRIWQVMARRMTESWTTVPHFYVSIECEAGALLEWRDSLQQRQSTKISMTDLLVKVVAVALRRHPRLNASWNAERIELNDEINIGLAVAVDEGLLAPVLRHADDCGIGELAKVRSDLVQRAKAGTLMPDDLNGATFTVSNLGMYGIDHFNAIVVPPQAAILAIGQLNQRCVPINGIPAVRTMVTLTLSCDHRVVDGVRAAQFLQTVAALIADPLALLD